MDFRHKKDTPLPPGHKKAGRHLILEILLFVLVFAACSLGNLLASIVLLECFLLPQSDRFQETAGPGNSMELVTDILSSPYFSLSMLFATAATVVIVILFCRFLQKRSWGSMGLSRKQSVPRYFQGFLFGCIAISTVVALCAVTGSGCFVNAQPASASLILLFLLAYLIQGASEELLCRGYFMYSIARRYPMWLAVVISSVFFALLHMPNNGLSFIALLNLFLFGVFAALATIQTGSVWYASGFHSAWNFFQGNFYGIKVSGMDMNATVLHFVSEPSKASLNGGDFGMEGGLLCTALLSAGIVFLLFKHKSPRSL